MTTPLHSISRLVALLGLALTSIASGPCFPELPLGTPGQWDYQSFGAVAVPGATFNAAALNTRFEHEGFSIDTKVGPRKSFRRVYNTGSRRWRASWEMSYDGSTFVDALGTVHDVTGVSHGSAIPGSHWVVVDADTVRTKGGLTYHFDAAGRLATETWSKSSFPRLDYIWDVDSVRVEECVSLYQQQAGACRLMATIQYGPHGPVEVVDEASAAAGTSRKATYLYDPEGLLSEAKTARQQAEGLPGTRYEYAASGLLTAQTLPDGERIEYAYAQTHLLEARQIGAGSPVTRLDYFAGANGAGHRVLVDPPAGGRTEYTVSEAGEVTRIERIDLAVPEVATLDWHAGLRRPSRITGFDGTARDFPTWVDDDPTQVIEPTGNTVTTVYAPNGINHADARARAVASVSDDLGLRLSTSYDPATGLPESETNGEGETRTYVYNGDKVVSTTGPWGETVDFVSFGASGHWRNAEATSNPEVPIRRRFDVVGNPTIPVASLQRGGVLDQTHDRDRRLSSVAVAATDQTGTVTAMGEVEIERRGDGQPLAIRRPLGADHEFEYDALGQLVRVCERVLGACNDTWFEYDAAGRQTAIERANGMREELDYDGYGRVVARRALRDGVLEGEQTLTWEGARVVGTYDSLRDETRTLTYGAAGRLASDSHSTHGEIRLLEYDTRSRLVHETFVAPPVMGGEVQVLSLLYTYDLADRRVRVSLYDGSPEGELLRETVVDDGRVVRVVDGNGNERESLFDPETGRLVGFETTDTAAQVVEDTTITQGVELGPTRYQVTTRTTTALATTNESYWLNRPGSLQELDGRVGMRIFRARGWDDGVLTHDRHYAWDALSNIADNAAGDTFNYNADRTRLLAATGDGWSHSYAYDAAGYVIQREGLEIAWTATGRVARVGPAAAPLAEATWDVSGGLVSVEADGEYREFTWFGGRVEHDTTSGGPGWLHIGAVSLPFAGPERRYRHADFRGNTSLVTDEAGGVVSHRRHHAFGLDRVHGSSGSGGSGLLEQIVLSGFAGGVAAQGLGLSFNGVRVLDTDVGRFLSPDPILNDLNQVAYTLGNPILFEDRTGTHQTTADALVATIATGGAFVYAFFGTFIPAVAAFNAAGVGAASLALTGVAVSSAFVSLGLPVLLVATSGIAFAWAVNALVTSIQQDSGRVTKQLTLQAGSDQGDALGSIRGNGRRNGGGSSNLVRTSDSLAIGAPAGAPPPCGPRYSMHAGPWTLIQIGALWTLILALMDRGRPSSGAASLPTPEEDGRAVPIHA